VATGEVRAAKAAMEPAVETTAMEPTAMRRKGGNWLGQCKNTYQSSCSNTQAAGDADPFHADLLLSIAARLAAPEE